MKKTVVLAVAALGGVVALAAPAGAAPRGLAAQMLTQRQVGPAAAWHRSTSSTSSDVGCLDGVLTSGLAEANVTYTNTRSHVAIAEEISRYQSAGRASAAWVDTVHTVEGCTSVTLAGTRFYVNPLRMLTSGHYRFKLSAIGVNADFTLIRQGQDLLLGEMVYPYPTRMPVLAIQDRDWRTALKDVKAH